MLNDTPVTLQEWAAKHGQNYRKIRAILNNVGSSKLPQAKAVNLTLINDQLAVWPSDSLNLLAFVTAVLGTEK